MGDTNKNLNVFEEFKTNHRYVGVTRQRREGKIAILGLSFTNIQGRVSRVVEVKMRNRGGYWQVAELSNLSELMQRAKAEEQERVAQRNAPILAKIASSIQIVDFSKESRAGEYGIGHKVIVKMSVKNLGDLAIWDYVATIHPKDGTGKVVKSFLIHSNKEITPHETVSGRWEFDINEFIPADVAFYKAPVTLKDVQFTSLGLEGSSELIVE